VKAINIINNSGENSEKFNFFEKFDWYSSYTFSMKSKFNNHVNQITFYPGQKILTEGHKNLDFMFIVVDGECNLLCTKTSDIFKTLENVDDPTKAKRDLERKKMTNPYKIV